MDHDALHRRAREKGVQPIIYWLVRAVFQPFFHLYFRLSRIGMEHIPSDLDDPRALAASDRQRGRPSTAVPFVPASVLRRVDVGDALLLHGAAPPAWVRRDRELATRGRHGDVPQVASKP